MALNIPGGVSWSSWSECGAVEPQTELQFQSPRTFTPTLNEAPQLEDGTITLGPSTSSLVIDFTETPNTTPQASQSSETPKTPAHPSQTLDDITEAPNTHAAQTEDRQTRRRTSSQVTSQRHNQRHLADDVRDGFESRVQYLKSITSSRRSPAEQAELRPYLTAELLERLLNQETVTPMAIAPLL